MKGDQSGLDDPAFTADIHFAIDAKDLGGASEAYGRAINRCGPKFAILDAAVGFIERLGLRGEACPGATAGLWPEPGRGWLPLRKNR